MRSIDFHASQKSFELKYFFYAHIKVVIEAQDGWRGYKKGILCLIKNTKLIFLSLL